MKNPICDYCGKEIISEKVPARFTTEIGTKENCAEYNYHRECIVMVKKFLGKGEVDRNGEVEIAMRKVARIIQETDMDFIADEGVLKVLDKKTGEKHTVFIGGC